MFEKNLLNLETKKLLNLETKKSKQTINIKDTFFKKICCGTRKKIIDITTKLNKDEYCNRDNVLVNINVKNTTSSFLDLEVKLTKTTKIKASVNKQKDMDLKFNEELYDSKLIKIKPSKQDFATCLDIELPIMLESTTYGN